MSALMDESQFQVLVCFARVRERALDLAALLRHKRDIHSATSSFEIRSYPESPFYFNCSVGITDSINNLIYWNLWCRFKTTWSIEMEIFFSNGEDKDNNNDVTIHSYPTKEPSNPPELIEALEWAITEIEISAASRDIAAWVALGKLEQSSNG